MQHDRSWIVEEMKQNETMKFEDVGLVEKQSSNIGAISGGMFPRALFSGGGDS